MRDPRPQGGIVPEPARRALTAMLSDRTRAVPVLSYGPSGENRDRFALDDLTRRRAGVELAGPAEPADRLLREKHWRDRDRRI